MTLQSDSDAGQMDLMLTWGQIRNQETPASVKSEIKSREDRLKRNLRCSFAISHWDVLQLPEQMQERQVLNS